MRKSFIFLLTLTLFSSTFAFSVTERKAVKAPSGGKLTIRILETTDIHGTIYPYDYFSGQDDEKGLAKVSTLVRRYRLENPNTLLFDDGDLIQGTPLTFLFNHKYPQEPNPMTAVLNAMGYDAFSVGNHDIEQGKTVYDRCRKESKFPWLGANAVMKDGSTYFDPYWVTEISGVRVGVLGMCTPGIPLWLNEELYPGIEFKDMVETANKWVPILREKEKVDVLIGLFHSGTNWEYDAETAKNQGIPLPNAAGIVAEKVPGFDLILTGHAHQVIPSKRNPEYKFGGVPVIQAGSRGLFLGIADVDLVEKNGRWIIADVRVKNESVKGIPADSVILKLAEEYHNRTLEYSGQVIGKLDVKLSGKYTSVEDTPLLDLINDAQLKASGADVSFASCFNANLQIEPGNLTVRDVYSIYRYENFLNKITMSGKQIDSYLENSVEHFRSYPFKNAENFSDKNISLHNIDAAQGINYIVDISRPAGDRITIKSFTSGRPFYADSLYTAALNSYRAEGGGGLLQEAGAGGAISSWKSDKDMREIIIDYLNSGNDIKCDHNWKLLPLEAVEQMKNALNE